MAAGRDLNARLIVRLQDRFSSGLSGLQNRLDRITGSLRRLSAISVIGGALALAGPISQAAAFEDILRQSAITAGATGTAVEQMVARNRLAFERLARETGQSSEAIAKANADLIAGGLAPDLIEQFLPLLARSATAAGASMEDLGRLARLLNQQLAITPEQLPQALAALAQAGRDGNFELRDMARELGAVLPIARTLGLQGPQAVAQLAASFQLAMRGANTTSEAANNVLNALQKLASPETVRSFAEVGVNLERLLASAARQGISPLEALVQKLRELTGGNLFRLSELFGDRQALLGLLPLITETARYIEIRDNAARATPALIDDAFQDRLRGAAIQLGLLNENFTQLYRRVSTVASEALAPLVGWLQRLNAWIDEIDQAYPGLIDKVIRFGLVIVAAVAVISSLVTIGGFIIGTLAPVAAFLTGTFGIAIAGVAAAAFLIYDNWEGIVGLFNRVRAAWDRFVNSEQAAETGRLFAAIARGISEAWEGVANVFRLVGEAIATTFRTILADLQPIIDAIKFVLESIPRLRPSGQSGPVAPQGRANFGGRGAATGFYGAEDALQPGTFPGSVRVGGEIIVRAAPGTEILDTSSRNPAVPVTPQRGPAVALP